MFRYGSIIGLVILVLDIIAIIEVFKSSKDSTAKLLWTILILIAPLVGLIIYYFFGRSGPITKPKI